MPFANKIELYSYLAGFIDGEGCLTIQTPRRRADGSRYLRPKIQVTNTNRTILDICLEEWGGYVTFHQPKNKKWRRRFDWAIEHPVDVLYCLDCIERFLILKRKQAKNLRRLSEFLSSRKKYSYYSPEEIAITEAMRVESSLLNRKGNDIAIQ